MPQSLKELLWGWELDQSIPKQIGLIKLIKFLPKRKNDTSKICLLKGLYRSNTTFSYLLQDFS